MDLAQLKLQQQSKCIHQLSLYIDQLQTKIEELKSQNEKLTKQIQSGHEMNLFVNPKFKNSNQLVRMMNEQMVMVEKEKKRCREEIKAKNRELQSQKELLQMQINNLRNIYEQKLSILEEEWGGKQKELRQTIKALQIENERLQEENIVYRNKLRNIDQCEEMLKIRKEIASLQNSKLKQSSISLQDYSIQQDSCQCFHEYSTIKTENSKLKNQNEILEFQLRHLKRQMERNVEIEIELREQIKDLQKKIRRQQSLNHINQKSSEIHSKVLLQLQQLKKERQISVDLLQTSQSIKQQHFFRSKEVQRLRKREEEELSKMSYIFQSINLDLSN